jgi:hypothetical protein
LRQKINAKTPGRKGKMEMTGKQTAKEQRVVLGVFASLRWMLV